MNETSKVDGSSNSEKIPGFGEMMQLYYDLVDQSRDNVKTKRLTELLTNIQLRDYFTNTYLVELIMSGDLESLQQERIPRILEIVEETVGTEEKQRIEELINRFVKRSS